MVYQKKKTFENINKYEFGFVNFKIISSFVQFNYKLSLENSTYPNKKNSRQHLNYFHYNKPGLYYNYNTDFSNINQLTSISEHFNGLVLGNNDFKNFFNSQGNLHARLLVATEVQPKSIEPQYYTKSSLFRVHVRPASYNEYFVSSGIGYINMIAERFKRKNQFDLSLLGKLSNISSIVYTSYLRYISQNTIRFKINQYDVYHKKPLAFYWFGLIIRDIINQTKSPAPYPRFANNTLKYFQDPIIYKLMNMTMRKGYKDKSIKLLSNIINYINLNNSVSPIRIIHSCLDNIRSFFEIKKSKQLKKLHATPVVIHPKRQLFLALKLVLSVRKRKTNSTEVIAKAFEDGYNKRGQVYEMYKTHLKEVLKNKKLMSIANPRRNLRNRSRVRKSVIQVRNYWFK